MDFAFLSVVELGRLLRQKKTSATELATYCLDRLERLGPRFNAVVTVSRERALAEAAEADREIRQGKWRGALHGIPYGVKDLLAAKGYPTTWGAEPYRQQTFDRDATPVLRYRSGDHLEVTATRCACGRTSPRARCSGRLAPLVTAEAPAANGQVRVQPAGDP